MLSPLVGNTTSFIASSAEFVSFSRSVTIPQNYELVSFDVVSLFTNVPVELAMSVVEKRLDEVDTVEYTPLPKGAIVSLLRMFLTSIWLWTLQRFLPFSGRDNLNREIFVLKNLFNKFSC